MSDDDKRYKDRLQKLTLKRLEDSTKKNWNEKLKIINAIFEFGCKVPYKQMVGKINSKDMKLINNINKTYKFDISKIKKTMKDISLIAKELKDKPLKAKTKKKDTKSGAKKSKKKSKAKKVNKAATEEVKDEVKDETIKTEAKDEINSDGNGNRVISADNGVKSDDTNSAVNDEVKDTDANGDANNDTSVVGGNDTETNDANDANDVNDANDANDADAGDENTDTNIGGNADEQKAIEELGNVANDANDANDESNAVNGDTNEEKTDANGNDSEVKNDEQNIETTEETGNDSNENKYANMSEDEAKWTILQELVVKKMKKQKKKTGAKKQELIVLEENLNAMFNALKNSTMKYKPLLAQLKPSNAMIKYDIKKEVKKCNEPFIDKSLDHYMIQIKAIGSKSKKKGGPDFSILKK